MQRSYGGPETRVEAHQQTSFILSVKLRCRLSGRVSAGGLVTVPGPCVLHSKAERQASPSLPESCGSASHSTTTLSRWQAWAQMN